MNKRNLCQSSWIDIIFLLFNLHHGSSANREEMRCRADESQKNPIEMLPSREVMKTTVYPNIS